MQYAPTPEERVAIYRRYAQDCPEALQKDINHMVELRKRGDISALANFMYGPNASFFRWLDNPASGC